MFNILTEDGVFNIVQEDGGAIQQEFSERAVSVSSENAITVSAGTTRNTRAGISSIGIIATTAIKAFTVSASISSVGVLFIQATKARSKSVIVNSVGTLSATFTTARSIPIIIEGNGQVVISSGGVKNKAINILSSAIVTVTTQSTRPEPVNSFRVVRNGSNAELTWGDGIRTSKVEIWRAVGVRSVFNKVGESTTETFTNSIDSAETYAYKLLPIGITGRIGQNSAIIYTATTKIL